MNVPQGDRSREKRWIAVASDGRYVTLGRHTNPTPNEIERANQSFRDAGLVGWLAIMEGSPHRDPMPRLLAVRALGEGNAPWAEVVAAFEAGVTRANVDK